MGTMIAANPSCPNLHTTKEAPGQFLGVFLESVRQNGNGDHLFECLACGYQAIYRYASGEFEKPSWWQARWQSPVKPGGQVDEPQPQTPSPVVRSLDPVDLQVIPPEEPKQDSPIHVEPPKAAAVSAATTGELVTIKDAATILGIKPTALLAKVKAGEVPSVTKDKVQYIPQSWVDEA